MQKIAVEAIQVKDNHNDVIKFIARSNFIRQVYLNPATLEPLKEGLITDTYGYIINTRSGQDMALPGEYIIRDQTGIFICDRLFFERHYQLKNQVLEENYVS